MPKYNYKTIQRIADDICKNSVPIFAHSEWEQAALFEKVKTFIASDKRLTTKEGKHKRMTDTDWVNYVAVIFKEYDKNFSPLPVIIFDKSGRLALDNTSSKNGCSLDFITLQRVIDEMFVLFDIDEADKLKKQKMRDLKTQGILAKLNEIAKEDGFKFHAEQIPTRVKLTIELPENKLLKIDVPFSNFQEVMQKVRVFIQNSSEIAETGIAFTIEKVKRR
jgi:hypothetical protein